MFSVCSQGGGGTTRYLPPCQGTYPPPGYLPPFPGQDRGEGGRTPGTYPYPHQGTYPPPVQDGGGGTPRYLPLSRSRLGEEGYTKVPTPAKVPTPHPGMPLAFMQEDFLVYHRLHHLRYSFSMCPSTKSMYLD